MGKTGYFCFMLVLKLLNVKSNNVQFDYFSDDSSMTDVHIVRAAKEMQLKVKISKFNKKRIQNLRVPIIAKCKDGSYILVLSNNVDKWMIMNPIKVSA